MKNEKSRNIAYLQLPLDKGLAQYKSVTMAYRSPKGVSVALLKNGTVTEGKILPEDAGEVERITLNGRQAKLYDLDDDADVRRIEFFKKFPGVRIDGDEESNPNYKGNAHCLDLIIPKQKASANILNNKVVSQLQLIIHNLDNNSRYNLAYPMGLPVQEMSSEEIYESLLNSASAFKEEDKTSPSYRLYNLLADRENIEFKLIIAKARHPYFNLLKLEDGVWKFNGAVIGATESQIKNHFMNNHEQYVILRRSVVSKDDLNTDEQDFVVDLDSEKWVEEMTKVDIANGLEIKVKVEEKDELLDDEGKIKAPKRSKGHRIQ